MKTKTLILTTIIQVLLLIIIELKFTLPKFAINIIENRFSNNQFNINVNSFKINIRGEIEINDIYINRNDRFNPYILYSKVLLIDFSWFDLITNSFIPSKIRIIDCSLFETMTGKFNPSINQLNGNFTSQNGIIRFDFKGYSNSTQLSITGSADNDKNLLTLFKKNEIRASDLNYNKLHIQILKLSNIINKISKNSKSSFVGININVQQKIYFNIFTEIHNYRNNQLSFDSLVSSVYLHLGQNSWQIIDIHWLLSNLMITKNNNQILVPLLSTFNQQQNLGRIENRTQLVSALIIPELHTKGSIHLSPVSIYFTCLLDSNLDIYFEGGLIKGSSFVYVNGQFDLSTLLTHISFDSQIMSSDFYDSKFYGIQLGDSITSFLPIRISSNLIKLSDGKLSKLNINLSINNLTFNRSYPLTVTSNIYYDQENPIIKSNFLGKVGSSHLNGFFIQDLDNLRYKLRLKGNCLPTDLNPFIRDWWDEIWEDFSFDSDPPYGDFKIHGTWGDSNADIKTWGNVSFGKVKFKNLTAINGDLRLSTSREQTNISAINVILEQGQLDGNLCFGRSKSGETRFFSFDVNGSLIPSQVKNIFGSQADKILSQFDTNSTVNLDAMGYIQLNPNESTDFNPTHFSIKAKADSAILFSGIELDSLSLEINSTSDLTKVSPLAFKIADGNGNGSLIFRQEKDLTNLEIDIGIKDADRKRFVQSMQLSETLNNREEGQLNLESNGSDSRGKLDLQLQVSGNPEDFLSFEGNGSILVKDPELGDIRLLGGLTDYLGASKLPLPSGAISFNRLEAPFTLNGDELRLGSLSLSGGSALLVANGIINLSKHVLDLEARLHLLGNVSVPVLGKLIQLLDPLSAVGNIKIDGTFEDPKWSIQLRPGKSALDVLFPKRTRSDKN